ncbi:phosphotransferase family protein [Kribbia dieselivorans]|uniref:phosphotransferase family protein n=1 Tax=Kribbia dieselivorans TaxID=331526 RepID=UPI000838AA76|nr:phosphotransferase family protein [Kribbia dieselivorans]
MEPDELVRTDRLGPALAEITGDDAWRDVHAELISGGKSNLTFFLRSDAGELVLRRPPTGELLPSAHDMMREARVQQALADTPVPTAPIILADSGDLIGVQAYVMAKVPGHIIRGELPADYATTDAERVAMSEVFVDTMAAIHAVDTDAVGLSDYGRPAGFMERQIRRWGGQWEKSKSHDVAEIDELGRRLAAAIPPQRRSGIVHGDFKIDNVVYDETNPGRIAAVLDWELSTLGDPMVDVGMLQLYWRNAVDGPLPLVPGVTHLPGFPDSDTLIKRYAAASGADLSDLGFYRAFAHFKFAIIAQGVSARFKAGVMGDQHLDNLDDDIKALAADGLNYI